MMDNKLSELSKPEQFDAAVEIHGGEPFAVWAPAVNGSHVKAELYFALLAELEAKDKRIAELERITEGVDQLAIDGGWTARGMSEYAKSLERRLATPVRLPGALIPAVHASGEPFMRPEPFGFYLNRDDVIKKLRAAGFPVEGDDA
ncbi:TPA: hypothetical protein ACKQER_000648 [Serratia marcescens]|uniref:hypothetical protein n=1 Tax=Serratia bockelmannii TaxID=2703793 RepID=UPI0038CBC0D2